MRSSVIFHIAACGISALTPFTAPAAGAVASCTHKGVEVQVLGSGGPELADKRASSSYLVLQDGRPRILVDSGGGSALQFGRAGAHVSQLDAIFFSHLHIDHTADFAALIKSSYFEARNRPLPVYGPSGNDFFPPTSEFVADLFDAKHGAYRYLAGFLSGGEDGYNLVAHDVTLGEHEVRAIYRSPDTVVLATRVIHGGVPALAWRVELGGKIVVFSGDTNGNNGNLEILAKGADVFVAHNAIPEGETGVVRELHMPPSVIGRIAGVANVKSLVLSHRMLRSLGHETETRAKIAAAYSGPIAFAEDLDCFH
jgi:ribonuclease BN (tRNA processing enzyme)